MSQEPDHDEKILQFMQMNNCDVEVANVYLEACGWNLETATDRYYATSGDVSKVTQNKPTPSAELIQSKMQELFSGNNSNGNIDVNLLQQMLNESDRQYIGNNDVNNNNLFDEDNNIRRPDMAYQEQLLPNQYIGTQIYQQQRDNLKNFSKQWQLGKKTSKADYLADLFSEPSYRFQGTFEEARKLASDKNLWLLVNIQTTESFVSHCLNRDVWKEKEFSKIIQDAFVFFQHESSTANGQRFVNLYSIVAAPCICIVDPNTGRKEKDFFVPDNPEKLDAIKTEITDFLDKYPNPHQKPKVTPIQKPVIPSLDADANDDENFQRALQMSLDESKLDELADMEKQKQDSTNHADNNNNVNDNDIDMSDQQNTNDISVDKLEPEPEEKDPDATAIRVRLPNGSMIQRRFKKSAKIEEVYKWISINEKQKKITLVQPMPRLILDDKKDQTLQQTGLIKAVLNCSYD